MLGGRAGTGKVDASTVATSMREVPNTALEIHIELHSSLHNYIHELLSSMLKI